MLHMAQCSGVSTLQEDTMIGLTLASMLWHVCMKLGNHGAVTVVHCIIRLMITTCPPNVDRSLGREVKSSQFSKWKITDTDTIMRVCVKG